MLAYGAMEEPLFVSLYLDEDVDVLVATLLRAKGFVVQTALEAGMLTKSDEEQMAFAASHGLALVTHNRNDFIQLFTTYTSEEESHGGIIISIRRSAYAIAQLLFDEVLNFYTSEEMQNRLLFL